MKFHKLFYVQAVETTKIKQTYVVVATSVMDARKKVDGYNTESIGANKQLPISTLKKLHQCESCGGIEFYAVAPSYNHAVHLIQKNGKGNDKVQHVRTEISDTGNDLDEDWFCSDCGEELSEEGHNRAFG